MVDGQSPGACSLRTDYTPYGVYGYTEQDGTAAGAVDYETNIRKPLLDRVDGFLVDDVGVMIAAIRSLNVADRVEPHPVLLPGDEFHFMFSQNSVDPAFMGAVDAALARMKADGRLQRIIDSYLE